MNTLKLRPNVPLEITLAFPQGKATSRGWMFGCMDGSALFTSTAAGCEIDARLRDLQASRGDRIVIHQAVSYGAAGRTSKIMVYRANRHVGEQPDGTFCVPKQPGTKEIA